MKNKPIKEGYKVWAISDHGYIWSWLWYSKKQGVEAIPKSVECNRNQGRGITTLAPTFALVIHLSKQLQALHLPFYIYIDNLFLNIPVAQCLLAIDIHCYNTTRKNARGIPQDLLDLQSHDSALVWDSTIATVVEEDTLVFLWQDNKPVIAITTAHSLHREEDRVERCRKCPAITAENTRILNPVFEGLPKRRLFIPKAIDDYNHHMKGVDQADYLRSKMTIHRPQIHRNWHPLFDFLVDVSHTNAYLLWL
jgi:Transposase IS4